MLGLRTVVGIDLHSLTSRFGFDLLEHNLGVVERGIREGYLVLDDDHLRPTLEGMAIADTLAGSFVVE